MGVGGVAGSDNGSFEGVDRFWGIRAGRRAVALHETVSKSHGRGAEKDPCIYDASGGGVVLGGKGIQKRALFVTYHAWMGEHGIGSVIGKSDVLEVH